VIKVINEHETWYSDWKKKFDEVNAKLDSYDADPSKMLGDGLKQFKEDIQEHRKCCKELIQHTDAQNAEMLRLSGLRD
jgi:hypothetical protein